MPGRRIKITAGTVSAFAALNDSRTSDLLWNALPITARGNTWGDEIYFSIPVKDSPAADARDVLEKGEIAYWSPGTAFCIFWGPTPASHGKEIRAASEVNPLGGIEGDAAVFDPVQNGAQVKLEKA